jgi:acetoacetyl-CoA synthetase
VSEPARGEVLWSPPPANRHETRLGRYLDWLDDSRGLHFDTYAELWEWSVRDLDAFWTSIWDHFDFGPRPDGRACAGSMPGTRWFAGAELNYAAVVAHASGARPGANAIVSVSQTRDRTGLTWDQLAGAVGRARAGLVRAGVVRGDRVAAYLPNIAETIVAFLATASLGAVWSSCAPEFGVRSVVDRFGQIEPKVLLAVDGYRYGSATVDRRDEVRAIRDALPSLAHTVVIPYLDPDASLDGARSWSEFTADCGAFVADPVPFDHPLYILYSSGTTGLPKAIVHGHGGIALEHMKAIALHGDLGPGDVFFWFTTTGWMMWNFLVSGLLAGTSVVCFDGNPAAPDLLALWRLAADERVTYFGTSAPFILSCRKDGLRPRDEVDLGAIRGVGSTGAPLPAEGFRWVYDAVGDDLVLGSISGGTDVCTAFVGMAPLLPVRAGEISCRYLGAAVAAFDERGEPVIDDVGELVVTAPMPSMPVGFWADDDGSKYRAAYFEDYAGVWRHGDWITIHADGSCVITGRSDATLNRGGVRLGTSEFYAVVEALPEIADSLVVHLDDPAGPGELLLFVVLRDGVELDDALRGRIGAELRRALSPRHVPDAVVAVRAVPRTLSGKKLEIPVKRILRGMAPDVAASTGALADPAALDEFERMAAERGAAARS